MARDLTRRPASECLYKRRAIRIPRGTTLDDTLTEARKPLSLRARCGDARGPDGAPGAAVPKAAAGRARPVGPPCGARALRVWPRRLAPSLSGPMLSGLALALALGGCDGG